MRIAFNGGGHHHSAEGILTEAREAGRLGMAGYWLARIFGPDSLTMHAAIDWFWALDLRTKCWWKGRLAQTSSAQKAK